MCLMDLLDILLLSLQLVVLVEQLVLIRGQLNLSEKIDKESKKREKGYFIIRETNFSCNGENISRYRENFDLHLPIKFFLSGNSDVAIRAATYSINGRKCFVKKSDPLFFTLDKRMNRFDLEVELEEQEYFCSPSLPIFPELHQNFRMQMLFFNLN